jgi:hypothetical protein
MTITPDYYTGRIEVFRPDAKPILTTTLDSILYQMVMKNKWPKLTDQPFCKYHAIKSQTV